MATLRSDLRTEIRDNLQEASGIDGAIWSDDLLNRHITREIRSLPAKDIYDEDIYTVTLDPTIDYSDGISLPTGTVKVEAVERNDGTSSFPDWIGISGVDNYNGAIFLPYRVHTAVSLRLKIKKTFTVPTDDVTALDIPDDKCEIVAAGVTLRCFKMLVAYLFKSISWDSVTKPGDVQVSVAQNWVRDAKKEYDEVIRNYRTEPRPRDIDLVS